LGSLEKQWMDWSLVGTNYVFDDQVNLDDYFLIEFR